MEDFQGKYNGKQIEQLLDKANDIDLSKYALKTDNAPTATKLQAARTIALSGAVIADDPGATGEFVWSITISNVPANVSIEELVATLSVTAAGGQKAQVTITQAAGDSTLEIDKETINLDVNGSAQTVNVISNDEWTWKNAASRTVMRMLGRL